MTDQAPELLPCPFCGSPANLRRFAVSKDEHTKISNMVSHIQCVNDEGCKVTVDIQHMNEAVAIEAWNTRPPSERPVAAIEIERLNAVILAHIENENKLYGEIRSLLALTTERPEAPKTRLENWAGTMRNVGDEPAKPDFETAARALGFQQMPNGKWWAPDPLWSVTYMARWDSAEAIFDWLWKDQERPEAAVAWQYIDMDGKPGLVTTRQFYALGAEHGQALRTEEEKGYARGLAAGRQFGPGWVSIENAPPGSYACVHAPEGKLEGADLSWMPEDRGQIPAHARRGMILPLPELKEGA